VKGQQSASESLLIVDDDPGFRSVYRELLEADGFTVLDAGTPARALELFAQHKPRLVVLDLMLPPSGQAKEGAALLEAFLAQQPGTQVVVVSGSSETQLALSLVKRGAYDFLTKPVDPDVLAAVLARAQARLTLEDRVNELETATLAAPMDGLLGHSPAFIAAKELAGRAALADVPMLLTGASGTGKELFARFIHRSSRRSKQHFVAVNCGALSPSLLESTLFGHKRGAFTGAVADAPGLFVQASGGTLFLDEIGDLELGLQVKLLRVLEAGEVMPVGSVKSVAVDVRVVSATHRDLLLMTKEGRFREDLFWRLRGIEVELPKLTDRLTDLELLANYFLHAARALVPGSREAQLAPSALRVLEAHDWPGNLRELRHEMQRALILSGGRAQIEAEDLSPSLRRRPNTPAGPPVTLEQKIEELERRELAQALEATGGNKSQAASRLGLSRQGFLNKLERYNLR
jgi:DNA-binding NtrC family response regulator